MIRSALLLLPFVLAATVTAQTPAYLSPVLLEPGNNSGKCLTAASNTNGAAVTLQTCTGADAQRWTFAGGQVQLFGGKCLDVTDGANVDGTKLQIWDCSTNGNVNQQFYYTGDYRCATGVFFPDADGETELKMVDSRGRTTGNAST